MAAQIPLSQKYGNEIRDSILPTNAPTGIGAFGPPYDPSDELVLPSQIGVRNKGTLGATIDAVRGVAFYADMIGFGAPSNQFTRNMGLKPYPLGVNYFIKTSQKCSNGEPMYEYVQGIPTGTALGVRMQSALAGMGYPPLKGLGPGMVEDVKDALNPKPLVRALFGSAYPRCKQVKERVGSSVNRLYALAANGQLDKNKPIVNDPDSVIYDGEANNFGPIPKQVRWVVDRYIDRETYLAELAAAEGATAAKAEGFAAAAAAKQTQIALGAAAGTLLIAGIIAWNCRL
jgi:hypothetical protein